jgi:hypothetical protein
MNSLRRTVVRRVSIKTSAGKVEIWEGAEGCVLELSYLGRTLDSINKPKETFDEVVARYKSNGHQVLGSLQAHDECSGLSTIGLRSIPVPCTLVPAMSIAV